MIATAVKRHKFHQSLPAKPGRWQATQAERGRPLERAGQAQSCASGRRAQHLELSYNSRVERYLARASRMIDRNDMPKLRVKMCELAEKVAGGFGVTLDYSERSVNDVERNDDIALKWKALIVNGGGEQSADARGDNQPLRRTEAAKWFSWIRRLFGRGPAPGGRVR